MPVKQTFTYSGDVSPKIPFHIWARRYLRVISPEYKRWEAAVKRQEQLRQQAIDAGYLIHDVENSVYVWNDEWAKDKEFYELKEYDEEWLEFWNRYLRDTGTEFKTDLNKE